MSHIDRQRISAVRLLQSMGYVFHDYWIAPTGTAVPSTTETDAMHALLVRRADQLDGCTESSPEGAELKVQAVRWS
jgi:hypothetical protein